MTDLSFSTLPVASTTNNASDVITPLNEIKAYVNGSGWVDSNRIVDGTVTDTDLASPNNSVYKTIAAGAGGQIGGTGVTGVHMFVVGYSSSVSWQPSGSYPTTSGVPLVLRLASSDYSVAGKTTKFRLKMNVIVGNTSPSTVVLTAGLYPLTVVSGNPTVGTVITGSTAASSGLSTNTISAFNSGDFSASALTSDPGNYCIGVNVTSISAPIGIGVAWELQYRHV